MLRLCKDMSYNMKKMSQLQINVITFALIVTDLRKIVY